MSRKPGCWKPWCRCWRNKCWKFGSRWPKPVLWRAWLKYPSYWGKGHVYICLFCGLWHWTHIRRGTVIRKPGPAQLRAIERRLAA